MTRVVALFARLWQRIEPRFDLYICSALTLAAFAVYVRTLTPGVLDGDSGEWQYMANILGVPHSTGYPLYILLAKIVTFLPFGNPAWRVNLFSAICAALTIPVVYLLAKRVSCHFEPSMRERSNATIEISRSARNDKTVARVAAILAASFFAFMPTLWGSATIAEVYALNTLLIALTLFFAIRFFDTPNNLVISNGVRYLAPLDMTNPVRDLYLMTLCFALALTNHRIAFFILPALLVIVWLKRSVLNLRVIFRIFLISLFALSLYLYIPLRASQLLQEQTAENWELYPRAQAIVNGKVTAYYNHTPAGFFNLVTALDNRNKLGFENADGENQTFARFENAWNLLREQIDPFGIALAVLGIVILFRRERALTLVLLLAGGGIAAVSVVLRAESTRFYFSGAYLVMILFFAVGVGWLLQKIKERAAEKNEIALRALYYAAIFFLAFFPITALYFNFAKMDASANTRYDAYARSILNDNLAPNAVLIAPWEVATPLRYFQFVENIRPDVLTIHESPVRPQYQKLFDAAQKQNRPFYYAQFFPEDKRSDAPRTVQAIAFPLPTPPAPQMPLNLALNDSIHLVGYDWIPNTAQGIRTARLALYYYVVQPTRVEYVIEVEVGDPQEETRGYWSQHPVSEYYPTYFWQTGKFYRDVYDVILENGAPRGEYAAEVTWYAYDAGSGKRDEASAQTIRLGGLRIQE